MFNWLFSAILQRLDRIEAKLNSVLKLAKEIKVTQAELAADLTKVKDVLVKIGTETSTLLQRIADLTALLANTPVTPELQAAVDAVKAQAQVVDDLCPDAP